jgi:cell division protein FtsZ
MNSPLLDVSAEGAHGVLLGISGGRDMRMTEVNEAAKLVSQAADPGAKIIFGAYYDRNLKPTQIKITLIATGLNGISSSNSLFGGYSKADLPLRAEERVRPEARTRLHSEEESEAKQPLPTAPATEESSKDKKKKTDSDAWDIPTFLRRRRR